MELVRYAEYQNSVAGVREKLVQYMNEFLCVFCIDMDSIHVTICNGAEITKSKIFYLVTRRFRN